MIHLFHPQYTQLAAAVVQAYPQEGCGLVLGRRVFRGASPEDDYREGTAIVTVPNAWSPGVLGDIDPGVAAAHSLRDRYWIDPAVLLREQRSARDQGVDIIGIYHSHPDHPAVPSECDRRLAWPVYSYLIAAVSRGQLTDLKSWRLNDEGQFQPEPVKILGPSANNYWLLS